MTGNKLKIFFASSSELKDERQRAEAVINLINKYTQSTQIEAIKWETDIESGSVQGERIQDDINPLLADSEIVFVLFYSRIGRFTLEEYKLARDLNKKVFIYFKEDFSPRGLDEIEEYKKVFEFKEYLEQNNQTIYREFKSIDQFENYLRQDINLYLSRHKHTVQRNKGERLEEYLTTVRQIATNREVSTSQPLFGKTLDDLERKQLNDFFEKDRVMAEFLDKDIDTKEKKLTGLHLMIEEEHLLKGTFLCFGKKVSDICPSAEPSKFFVFETTDISKPIINETASGNLIVQYFKLLGHLKKNLYLIRDIYSDNEEDYEVPEVVLRELLANALVHRDFSHDIKSNIQVEMYPDRLEIKNPGSFPDEIDLKNTEEIEISYQRNMEIASIFFLYEQVERAGLGISRIQEILRKNGFRPAVFIQNKRMRYVKVTVYKKTRLPEPAVDNKKSVQLLTLLPAKRISFTGRKKELDIIKERLNRSGRRSLLLTGLGGIGKTEVCKRYFLDHYKDFAYAAWIDWASSIKESLVHSFDNEANEMMKSKPDENIDERFQRIVDALTGLGERVFLVIDNIESQDDPDIDLLLQLPCTILANSRYMLQGFESINLDVLDKENCMKLFFQFYQDRQPGDEKLAQEIISLCGNHPLTVELLARTAWSAALDLETLLDILKEKGFNLNNIIQETVSTNWHNQQSNKRFFDHLLTIFDLSRLTEQELHILSNLSILPPVGIHINDLREWLELENKSDIHSLVQKGCLKREGFEISMHQVLKEVVRHQTPPDIENVHSLITSIGNQLFLQPGDNPFDKKKLTLLAESVLKNIKENNADLASLSNNLSVIFESMGNLSKALESQIKSIQIKENLFDSNHPSLAVAYNNLSMIYNATGQMDKALEFQIKSLEISENIFDKEHPNLAASYNNLSQIYRDLGELEKALEFQLKAIAIYEKILDENHPEIATSYNNLSLIYLDMGDLEKALEFQQKALAIFERILGNNHPSLATSYNNLALIYANMNKFSLALEYYDKAISILETLFPDGHPHLDIMEENLQAIREELGQ